MLQNPTLKFIKKKSSAQTFSFEFCKSFKNTIWMEQIQSTLFVFLRKLSVVFLFIRRTHVFDLGSASCLFIENLPREAIFSDLLC